MELLGPSLQSLFEFCGNQFGTKTICWIAIEMIKRIETMHAANFIHRDLKPGNLLLNTACDVKLCDFGMARPNTQFLRTPSAEMTEYIVTRHYRAPELILEVKQYSSAIDVWSIGCILAEMILRETLLSGKSGTNQLEMIVKLCGTPSDDFINSIEDDNQR